MLLAKLGLEDEDRLLDDDEPVEDLDERTRLAVLDAKDTPCVALASSLSPAFLQELFFSLGIFNVLLVEL